MRHLIDIVDLSPTELEQILGLGEEIISREADFFGSAAGKQLATLFFEPSTRTRLSFESAMLGLGGSVLGFSESASSSVSKGESLCDTIRTVGCYADVIAIRHPLEGAPMMAAGKSPVPIINGGDGGHCHPTQTLTDLLTIRREKGQIHGLTVGLCGDLKYGRTVHSLLGALGYYRDIRLVFISPKELAIPGYIKDGILKNSGMAWRETERLEEALPELDVLYMTRIQKERFGDPQEFLRLKDSFVLTAESMREMRRDAIVMHPLPRVGEIAVEVDDDPRACYFRQMKNGKYVRMALIHTLLSGGLAEKERTAAADGGGRRCGNPRCITAAEREARQAFVREGDAMKCLYCEARLS